MIPKSEKQAKYLKKYIWLINMRKIAQIHQLQTMQIKISMRYHFASTTLVNFKSLTIPSDDKYTQQWEPPSLLHTDILENNLIISSKLQMSISQNPAMLPLVCTSQRNSCIFPRNHVKEYCLQHYLKEKIFNSLEVQ